MTPHGHLNKVPEYEVSTLNPLCQTTALVIPVLNENGRFLDQLRRIKALSPSVDIVIADGGSSDGSTDPDELRDLGVVALLLKTGEGGLSAQLRMAFDYCLSRGYASVITMDGNGKDEPQGIIEISCALNAGADLVQGSRFMPGGMAVNTPVSRYLAVRLIHAPMTSLAARQKFTDSTNGFRGFSMRLLSDSRISIFRDVFQTYELLAYLPIRAARLGFKVTEVPVIRSYPKGLPAPTKIHGWTAHLKLLQILLKACSGKYDPAN